MATRHSTRRPVGSSLSTRSPEAPQQSTSADGKDPFDDLFRRLLVAISHVQLVTQHFGDLSGLSREDAPAGMTLYEAAQDLDQLYDDLDSWYVQHEHRPKTIETIEPSVHPTGTFITDNLDRTPVPDVPAALPCPFCGQHNDLLIVEVKEHAPWYRAQCGVCGVDAPGGETQCEAATHWNTRHGEVPS